MKSVFGIHLLRPITAQDHRIVGTDPSLARAQCGANQRTRRPLENHQWQVAGGAVMVSVKRQRLWALERIV